MRANKGYRACQCTLTSPIVLGRTFEDSAKRPIGPEFASEETARAGSNAIAVEYHLTRKEQSKEIEEERVLKHWDWS